MKREFTLLNGDRLVCTEKAAVLTFARQRAVLSTGALGGGLRLDLEAVFNYNDCGPSGVCPPMEGRNLLEHQTAVARRLGLDPARTTGLDTAVNLDNLVVETRRWEDLWVTAAVSAGAGSNALCAGDPAYLTEREGEPCPLPPGTINIILVTGRDLAPGAMGELLVTAAEAKAAALRDLMQGSCLTSALATGTGTDGTVVVSGGEGPTLLNGGKHFKLGELAAQAVGHGVREALFRQTGLCPQTQHSVFARLRRFGVTARDLERRCRERLPKAEGAEEVLRRMDQDSFLVAATALCVHLMDQQSAGLFTGAEAEDWGRWLLAEVCRHFSCPPPVWAGGSLREAVEDLLLGLLVTHLEERRRLYPTSQG